MKTRTRRRRVGTPKSAAPVTKEQGGVAAGPFGAPATAQFQTRLPAMTFGQLRTLARAGSPPGATIREVNGGYVVELDVGPRRWILISTHGKRPRMFQHLDGAANAMRDLGAHSVQLQLAGDEAAPPALPADRE